MSARTVSSAPRRPDATNALKGWLMVALTLAFVALYGAALTGWPKPLDDEKMVARLEPIIFVIIGYYFGRLPAQQNEKTLRDEISRQTQKSDAGQHAKEQAQQAAEALEEKLKNVRAVLAPSASAAADRARGTSGAATDGTLYHSVAAALDILNS